MVLVIVPTCDKRHENSFRFAIPEDFFRFSIPAEATQHTDYSNQKVLRIIRTPIEIYRRSIEHISIDPLRPAATRYDPHGSVLTLQFSWFGSHGSCLTVRFTRFGSHGSVRTVRFHDSMPRLNAPFSLERFGSHGLVHTG